MPEHENWYKNIKKDDKRQERGYGRRDRDRSPSSSPDERKKDKKSKRKHRNRSESSERERSYSRDKKRTVLFMQTEDTAKSRGKKRSERRSQRGVLPIPDDTFINLLKIFIHNKSNSNILKSFIFDLIFQPKMLLSNS